MTGIRENPDRSPSDSACLRVFVRSMKIISVRGTMTSFAYVSPNSKTEWIICRSSSSMRLSASA